MDISERLVNMILRVMIYLEEVINGEPLPHMPIQETSGQENVEQESFEQRELSSKLVTLRRGSIMMQEQGSSSAELESCEQRVLSSRLVSRRGSVKIQGH